MSRVIDSREDNAANGEWPNTASVPSVPLSRKRKLSRSSKRPRDKEGSFNDTHPRNHSGPEKKTATDSAELIIDLELTDDVEVSPHRKRRAVEIRERSAKNDAAGKSLQILKGVHATEQDVDGEDSEQTIRNDGYAKTDSQEPSTSKPPSNALRQQLRVSAWEDRLSELADYRKIHGHCNVPTNYSENSKLARWVGTQRNQYRLHLEGKKSYMTLSRIQALESLGFKKRGSYMHSTAWEDRLSELADSVSRNWKAWILNGGSATAPSGKIV
jgi:hypothetical protein